MNTQYVVCRCIAWCVSLRNGHLLKRKLMKAHDKGMIVIWDSVRDRAIDHHEARDQGRPPFSALSNLVPSGGFHSKSHTMHVHRIAHLTTCFGISFSLVHNITWRNGELEIFQYNTAKQPIRATFVSKFQYHSVCTFPNFFYGIMSILSFGLIHAIIDEELNN